MKGSDIIEETVKIFIIDEVEINNIQEIYNSIKRQLNKNNNNNVELKEKIISVKKEENKSQNDNNIQNIIVSENINKEDKSHLEENNKGKDYLVKKTEIKNKEIIKNEKTNMAEDNNQVNNINNNTTQKQRKFNDITLNSILEISFSIIKEVKNGNKNTSSQNSTYNDQLLEKDLEKKDNYLPKINENNIISHNNDKINNNLIETSEKNNNKSIDNEKEYEVNEINKKIEQNIISDNIIISNEKENNTTKITNYQYFQKQCEKYKKMNFKVDVLENIINKQRNFKFYDISYLNNNRERYNPSEKLNDRILQDLLSSLELEKEFINDNNYGYFCYKKEDGIYIEALYSTINNEIVYEFSDKNKAIDDFLCPDEDIQNKYFKSRALTLEYYIDKTIFEKKYNSKVYPRILFPLQKLFITKSGEMIYDKYFYEHEIEIDGAYLLNNDFDIVNKDFPFVHQYYNRYDILKYNLNHELKYLQNNYIFKKDDLCIIEVKNQFPPKTYDITTSKKDLETVVLEMLKKMYVFMQLFNKDNIIEKCNSIRLILFYDVVKKKKFSIIYRKSNENFLL